MTGGRCLRHHELARLVGAEALDVTALPAHVEDCLACRRELARQRAVRAALRSVAIPRLDASRRRAIKAETMATIGLAPAPRDASRRGRAVAVGVAAAAVAAVAAAAVFAVRASAREPAATVALAAPDAPSPSPEAVVMRVQLAAHESAPPPSAPIDAVLSHAQSLQRDVITLDDGVIEVDTRRTRDTDVRVGATTVRIDDGDVRVRASRRAIAGVDVIIGSARVIGPELRITLERGVVWTATPREPLAALASFRQAWVALRDGDNRNAIALFDRATDSTVAEEAMYWAAVATKRAGDAGAARQRFSEFVARFPSSPYAVPARHALTDAP